MLNIPVGIRTPHRKAAACCAVLFGLACHVPAARAALTEADANSGAQTTYDSNILANDIIQNGSGALAGAPTTSGSVANFPGDVAPYNNWSNLTDGAASTKVSNNDISHDTYFDSGAFATNPTITYTFNPVLANGVTITKINSISGWADTTSFSNQKYNVFASFVGSPSNFVQVATVNYAPFTGNAGTPNSSQVTLTDPGNTLVGVAALRFAFLSNGGSGQVFREIDVTGTPEPASLGLIGLGSLLFLRRTARNFRIPRGGFHA